MSRDASSEREWRSQFEGTVWGTFSEGPAFWEWPGIGWRWTRRQIARPFHKKATIADRQPTRRSSNGS